MAGEMSESGAKKITAVILAAGQGTRMKSSWPKVLHRMCGRPMIDFVVAAALEAGVDDAVVVIGHGSEEVSAHLDATFGNRVRTAMQPERMGTGHAAQCALSAVDDDADEVLLLCGDTPLLDPNDLQRLLSVRRQADALLALLTCRVADPSGYGRIVRNADGQVGAIVEHRDADEEQRRIDEINPAVYAARIDFLHDALMGLHSDNDQGELYLTDIVAIAALKSRVDSSSASAASLVGVNDRSQLAAAEEVMFTRIGDGLRRAGATIATGARIDAGVSVERDAVISHGVVLRGATSIGEGARVDVGCVLDDVEVAANAYLKPYSVCQQSSIGEEAQIGPFSNLRPDSVIDARAKVGNFVETKKVHLHADAKANHLSYLGDGEVGEGANIGAGTIFCNYDGFQKHKTVIGAGAFIGSDSQIVAPVTVGEGAYVATGTTVTMDVPANALAIGRTRQDNKEGYATRIKERLKAAAARAKKT
jgi:bifunctional UDP-N-acetylglucosamine pyrophosphorylase/glucosamine-1-phosphate N-acetyltransferase